MGNLKTFQQILNEGYQFPLTVDTATQQTITEWFQFRLVADNVKFIPWFNRQLTLNYPYYRQLLRIDPSTSSFDWLVMQYSEHESITSSESNQSGYTSVEGTTVNNGTSENVSTSSGTSNVTSKNDGTTTDKTTGTTTGNNQGFDRQTGLSRVSPMSSDYTVDDMKQRNSDKITVGKQSISGYAHGMPYAVINNPSATSDTLTENGTLSAGTNESTTNGSTTANGTTDTTDSSTGTVTGNTSNTATNNSATTGKNSNETNATVHDITSGRTLPIAELLTQAKGYILQSKAWLYLYKELDMCFCQSYLESEDE